MEEMIRQLAEELGQKAQYVENPGKAWPHAGFESTGAVHKIRSFRQAKLVKSSRPRIHSFWRRFAQAYVQKNRGSCRRSRF